MNLKPAFGLCLMSLLLLPVESNAFNISQSICEFVAADDKKRLRSLQKTHKFKLRKIFKDVRCNNDNILIFAAKRNSNDVGELLIKKLPKKVLLQQMEELESISPTLAAIAKERAG